jgi:hypothetical protein
MSSAIETVVTRLLDIGFYDFLIFILALPLFFALLKKTKILGDNTAVNGLVAFVGAFLVFSFPIITGTSLTFQFSTLFAQAAMFVMIFVVAFLVASFFYPDLLGILKAKFTSRSMLIVGILIGLTVAITSGLLPAVLTATSSPNAPSTPGPSGDIINFAVGILIFLVVLVIAMIATREGMK